MPAELTVLDHARRVIRGCLDRLTERGATEAALAEVLPRVTAV